MCPKIKAVFQKNESKQGGKVAILASRATTSSLNAMATNTSVKLGGHQMNNFLLIPLASYGENDARARGDQRVTDAATRKSV